MAHFSYEKTLKPKKLQSKFALFKKKNMIQHALTAFIPNKQASVNVRKLILIIRHMCRDHLLSQYLFSPFTAIQFLPRNMPSQK